EAARRELVEERHRQDVPDAALRIGRRHLERELRHGRRVTDELGAQEDEADLRTVPMGQDDAPSLRDECRDVTGHLSRVVDLLGDRSLLPVEDQRVAADRHHGAVGRHAAAPTPKLRARARTPSSKQASGARAIPAPIWPTPASRWAIPVLITGAMPVSTTRRASI